MSKTSRERINCSQHIFPNSRSAVDAINSIRILRIQATFPSTYLTRYFPVFFSMYISCRQKL